MYEKVVWISLSTENIENKRAIDVVWDSIASSLESFSLLTSSQDKSEHSAEEAAGRLREHTERLLQEHRIIVVIDDLEDKTASDLIVWLDNTSRQPIVKSRFLITSRKTKLQGRSVEVERLDGNESKEMLTELAHELRLRHEVKNGLSDEMKKKIISCSKGNPQAMRFALGVVMGTNNFASVDACLKLEDSSIEKISSLLLDDIWKNLGGNQKEVGKDAQTVLESTLAFPLSQPIPLEFLQKASGLSASEFEKGVNECMRFGLFDRDVIRDQISLHRTLNLYIARQNIQSGTLESIYKRLAEYLLEFLRNPNVVKRRDIDEQYWDALVRDEMVKIDPVWLLIHEVMKWSAKDRSRDDILINFFFLLVHYMDSRFLNVERIEFARAAINVLKDQETRKYHCALLRIDALGWTYIEEGNLEGAEKEILEGLSSLGSEENINLEVLAFTWRARIACLRKNEHQAKNLISHASNSISKVKPWIAARVHMVAGDIALNWNAYPDALTHYQEAEAFTEIYGDEGHGYQTRPRIGLLFLKQKQYDKAKRVFENLADNKDVSIGKLYGKYGLALVAAEENWTLDARRRVLELRDEISRRTNQNILLTLTDELLQEIARRN